MSDWIDAYLKAGGYKDTPQTRQFLATWQRFEGGATHNNATNNYLNTTWGKGFPAINDVGVKAYPSLEVGARAFANTLRDNPNYSGLVEALSAGDPYTKQSVAALSTWLTGKPDDPRGLAYASKVLGTHVPVPSEPAAAPTPEAPAPARVPHVDLREVAQKNLAGIAAGTVQPTDMLAALVAARQSGDQGVESPTPGAPLERQSGSSVRGLGFKPGDPIPLKRQTSIGGEHETEGLPGYPARDYFAKAGTRVVAPITGKVIKLSGHDPRLGPVEGPHGPLGWSVYIQGDDGNIYYLTHMGSRSVKVGQKVTKDTVIGTVANYARYGTPSHIHMGVHSGGGE